MNIGPMELGIILVIVLIIFGAGKISEVGSALGKGIREFRQASEGTGEDETAPAEPVAETD